MRTPILLPAVAACLFLASPPAGAQTEIGPAVNGRIMDEVAFDDVGDNTAGEPRVGDEDGANPVLTDRHENRALWEFDIDPVRSEIEDAIAVFFEVTVTDKSDPLGEGDAKMNFRLQAMESASEDGIRGTLDYHSNANPVGPTFVFADVFPLDRLSINVTNAAKNDAAQPGDFSGFRFQVLVPAVVGDDDERSEYVEFDQAEGADAKLVIYGVGDPLPPVQVPALGSAAAWLLSSLVAASGAWQLRRRRRRSG
ncbi:MAG: hypothetical protein ACQGVC_13755 [Myxococcota bacterium]